MSSQMSRSIRAVAVALLATCVWTAAYAGVEKRKIDVTVDQGTSMSVAIAPDRKTLAIDLQGRIWTLPVKGGAATAITEMLEDSRLPTWSPDGKQLAYQCFVADYWRICTVRADGAGRRVLTSGSFDSREPTWHPNGRSIVYASDRDRADNYELWTLDTESLESTRLTRTPEDEAYAAWSPDGRSIAFVAVGAEGNSELKIATAEAGELRSIRTALSSKGALLLPAWSPAGTRLSYLESQPSYGGTMLYMVDTGGGASQRLTDPGEDVFPTRAAWTTETQFVYTSNGHIQQRSIGERARAIPFEATFVLERHAYQRRAVDLASARPRPAKGIFRPMVSPDGTHVAFAALGDLWLLRIGDPRPQPLTSDPFLDADPAWSADGESLVFTSDRRDTGTMDLWVRDMRSGRERALTSTEESASLPSWSPDGSKIAFYLADSRDWHARYLHVLDLESGSLERLYGWLFMPSRPSWAPDGKSISVSALRTRSGRSRKGYNEILRISVADKSSRWITPTPDSSLGMRGSNGPEWAPDGSAVAYTAGGVLWSWAVDSRGEGIEPPRRLTTELADSLSWTSDARSIVYLSGERLRRLRIESGAIESIPLGLDWTPSVPQGRKVVQAGRLFDAKAGTYRRDVDVVIEGNRITSVVPRRADWSDAVVIDARGKTVVPGLFENHIHQFSVNGERTGRLMLAYGITSVREVGADPYEALEAKEAWASGARLGPRQFYTGLLEGSRIYYQMSLPISTDASLDLELERAARLEYDLVKTYERLSDQNLRRVIDWSHSHGLHVTSHDLYPAVALGIDAVEHVGTDDRDAFEDRLSLNGRAYADVIDLSTAGGMIVVPTSYWGRDDVMKAKEGWSPMSLAQFARLAPKRYQAVPAPKDAQSAQWELDATVRMLGAFNTVVRDIFKAGGTLLAGTDSGFNTAGLTLIIEMQELVRSGVSPAEAIRAATINAAELLGVGEQLGSIEAGKLADLVIVDGDPLANILDLHKVDTVIKNGHAYPLERLLLDPWLRHRSTTVPASSAHERSDGGLPAHPVAAQGK